MLGFAVSLWARGPGEAVLDAQGFASSCEQAGAVGRAIVGVHLDEARAQVVIDSHMRDLPARSPGSIAAIASDPMAVAFVAVELLGVHMQQFARCRAFVVTCLL